MVQAVVRHGVARSCRVRWHQHRWLVHFEDRTTLSSYRRLASFRKERRNLTSRVPRSNWAHLLERETGTNSLVDAIEKLSVDSAEGIRYYPLYHDDDVPAKDDAMPGVFPYKRGVHASMYTGRPWTMRQYGGFGSAESTNELFHEALRGGARGLSVAFDLPTHRGFDSDNERCKGDVGMAGVAVDTVNDMASMFRGIDLGSVSVSMTMNGAVVPVLAFFVVAADEMGIASHQLTGTLQNDILKEFLVRNTFIYPPRPSLRITGDIIRYCTSAMPRFNPISVSGYHMQEAGADAATELGLTIADGLEYLSVGQSAGVDVEKVASRMSFFFGIGMNFYMEIAKLRAARVLWAENAARLFPVLRDRPECLRLRTHCQTSGYSLTEQDPVNNVVRTTVEAMAAVFGGTQSLHTNALDEALALPSPTCSRIARNTQLILQHETDICRVADPWGGSFMMESLTSQLQKRAQEIIDEVSARGGMCAAVEDGWAKLRIEERAAARQGRIDSKQEIIVGVNAFRADPLDNVNSRPREEPDVLVVDGDRVREEQIRKLQGVRSTRDQARVDYALGMLEEAARDPTGRIMDWAIEAARARATLGEISSRLERVFGVHRGSTRVVSGEYARSMGDGVDGRRDDEELREVQERADAFALRHGRRPRMLVAKLGQDGHDRGARVIASGFSDLGFDVDVGPLFATPVEVARLAVEADVHVVGVSSQAAGHRMLVPELVKHLDALGAGDVAVVVGGVVPPQDHAALRAIGVALILGPGTRVVDAARAVLSLLPQGPPKEPKQSGRQERGP